MKKLLLGSIALSLFAISLLLFQISCKKEAAAQTDKTGSTSSSTILYSKYNAYVNASEQELWIAKIDGSNQHKIPIVLPSGLALYGEGAHLTPNGQQVIFEVGNGGYWTYVYSCNIDGSNLKKIIDNPDQSSTFDIQDVN